MENFLFAVILLHKTMLEQPTDPQPTNPQSSANGHIHCKHQAHLDDNGEPAGLPALKKV